jgi:flagellar assembly factor FliW
VQIETRRFGVLEVDDQSTFAVKAGIPGFPGMRRVALLGAGVLPGDGPSDDTGAGADHAMFWMQDLDDGELAFLCIVPWIAFPEYDIEIDERSLGIADGADVQILSLVTTRREDGAAHLTANLRAPLVVDTASRRLQQVILSDSRWPIRAPFATLASAAADDRAS